MNRRDDPFVLPRQARDSPDRFRRLSHFYCPLIHPIGICPAEADANVAVGPNRRHPIGRTTMNTIPAPRVHGHATATKWLTALAVGAAALLGTARSAEAREAIYVYSIYFKHPQTQQWMQYPNSRLYVQDAQRWWAYNKSTYPQLEWTYTQEFWRWSDDAGNGGAIDFDVAGVAAGNSLVPAGYPTRGFGNSDQPDVWVPFHFAGPAGNMRGARGAKIVMNVRPISQLIGTDMLILKGASGQSHTVYNGFDKLDTNRWNTVTVDVSGNADVMNAIRNGRLEGLIQDDTAVLSVKLVITLGG